MKFADEIDEYIILKMSLNKYIETKRILVVGFKIVGFEFKNKIRKEEKKILKFYFNNWKAPYFGRLKGWRKDSPIYLVNNEKLVSGLYLCDKNEVDQVEGWGQMHYPFVDPSYTMRGFHSILFRECINKARDWNLNGIIIKTDRYSLSDVWVRWGANQCGKIKK